MRIQETYYLMRNAYENWVNPNTYRDPRDSRDSDLPQRSAMYVWRNSKEVAALLEPLKAISPISNMIDSIYSYLPMVTVDGPVYLSRDGYNNLISGMEKIHGCLSIVLNIYDVCGVKCDSSGFDIKLPPDITLAELSKCTRDLDNIFSQCPLLQCPDEEVRLRGVDIGSIWISFSIICAGAATTFYILNNLAAIVDKVMAIREHMAICRQHEELARQSKLKNDALQSIVESHRMIIKSLTMNAAEELATEHGIESPEDVERIRVSLDTLKEWVDKGLQIHAAIEAPNEIKAVFPPLETQALPDFAAKKLNEHNDNEDG